jgi:enediyne polyketide synthase
VAECAFALAREIGVSLLLVGRTFPEQDAELARGLERFRREGARFRYAAVDVTDEEAMRRAISEHERQWGAVRGILHGAGVNRPALLSELDEEALGRTARPKLLGLRNLLQSVDEAKLRLLATFGSVIGRVGLAGQADYALANSLLTLWCRQFGAAHPACHCLALEWSVWADVGMGERPGRRQALRRQGIQAITPAAGTALFLRLLRSEHVPAAPAMPEPPPALVVSGRLGAFPPLPLEGGALPLLRYLERPRVHYPGVELVCDAEVSRASDPYLDDHMFQRRALLPAVLGLEAMGQAAQALTGQRQPPIFERVTFDHAVAVAERPITLRVAALVQADGSVDVALRSSATAFAIDHFRARCRFGVDGREADEATQPEGDGRVPLEPGRDLYGTLLFQTGRFRRVTGYRELSADRSWAELAPSGGQAWFGPYLPQELVLGDPGARDAAVHSIQACVPHALLLPVAVDHVHAAVLPAAEPLVAHARERWRKGDRYGYDLEIRDARGRVSERWRGLTLQKVAEAPAASWPAALLPPSVEWRLRDLLEGARVRVALDVEDGTARPERQERNHTARRRLLLRSTRVTRRVSGAGQADGDMAVSAAHAQDITLAVAARDRVGCDIEPVKERSADTWHDLLGGSGWSLAQAIARQAGEDVHTSATRVWTALESLRKTVPARSGPLLLHSCESDGWVRLDSADSAVATYPARLQRQPAALVLAISVSHSTCAVTSTDIASTSSTPTF